MPANLKHHIRLAKIQEYKVGCNEFAISHLFYADDVHLFTNGSSGSLHNLMTVLTATERSFGQQMNLNKSAFYVGARDQHRVPTIAGILGVFQRQLPFIYLGLPIFVGRIKTIYYDHLMDKIRHMLQGWKERLLSFPGKLILIKSVLTSIPIYSLASAVVTKAISNHIEQLMAKFLWSVKGKKCFHWVRWAMVCLPIEEGGLGVRRFEKNSKMSPCEVDVVGYEY